MAVFVGQKDSLCCHVLPSLCCVLRQVLDDREDRVCLLFNQLLQRDDLLILFVEVLQHIFDICVCLHGRSIGLSRLEFGLSTHSILADHDHREEHIVQQ